MELADAAPESKTTTRRASRPVGRGMQRMNEFRTPAELGRIRDLRRHVYQEGGRLGVPVSTLDAFNTALSELASNVIRHPQPPATQLRLALEFGHQGLTATLRSDADSFADRRELFAHARPSAHMRSGAPSGRGLYLALCLFPFMGYEPRSARTDGYECYILSQDFERRLAHG